MATRVLQSPAVIRRLAACPRAISGKQCTGETASCAQLAGQMLRLFLTWMQPRSGDGQLLLHR